MVQREITKDGCYDGYAVRDAVFPGSLFIDSFFGDSLRRGIFLNKIRTTWFRHVFLLGDTNKRYQQKVQVFGNQYTRLAATNRRREKVIEK